MATKQEEIVLAVLAVATRSGVRRLLKTTFVKLVYLLDVHTAEIQGGGSTATGWEWRFVHYGPYAPAFDDAVRGLEKSRHLAAEERYAEGSGNDYIVYRLIDAPNALRTLSNLGVPKHAELALAADIKRYGREPLRKILDYVYFHTPPMQDAEPGAVLSFERCEAVSAEALRPVKMRTLRPKRVKQTRDRVRQLIAEIKSNNRPLESGPFDDVYYNGLRELEGEPIAPGLRGDARIKIKNS